MNNGAPIMDVTTPIGNSDGRIIVLERASDKARKEAPIRADAGMRNLLS
jgi:hypothetical protein